MTHESSSATEADCYLAQRLAPLRPVLSFGRCPDAEPKCTPGEAVRSWWQACAWVSRGLTSDAVSQWDYVNNEVGEFEPSAISPSSNLTRSRVM